MPGRWTIPSSGKGYLLLAFLIPLMITSALIINDHTAQPQVNLRDWGTVEGALNKTGDMLPGGVFMIELPRDDIQIAIGNVTLERQMSLHSWVAFMDMGHEAMMMGDLVLLPDEVMAIQGALLREGIDITAIHTTLIGQTPQVYDLHFSGTGDPVKMAGAVRNATSSAGVPISAPDDEPDLQAWPDKAGIDQIIGTGGKIEGKVLYYSIPRVETIREGGMEIPSSLDVATQLRFQPLPDSKAATTGEFVLTAGEVEQVIRALNMGGIEVTGLHTHMLAEEPRLYYLHFWAVGDRRQLAETLRDAVSRTNSKIEAQPATMQAPRSD